MTVTEENRIGVEVVRKTKRDEINQIELKVPFAIKYISNFLIL